MVELTYKDKEMLDMWKQGLTALQISQHFKITRNAVMGRLSRLRVAGFVGYKKTKPIVRKVFKNTDKQERAEIKKIISVKRKELKYKIGFSLMELEFGMCKYPISGEHASEFMFCGKPSHQKSYCEEHHKICWYPAGRKDRDQKSTFILKRYKHDITT